MAKLSLLRRQIILALCAVGLLMIGFGLGSWLGGEDKVNVTTQPTSNNSAQLNSSNPSCQISRFGGQTTCTLEYSQAAEVKVKFEPANISPSININCQSRSGCSTVTDNNGSTVKINEAATLEITVNNQAESGGRDYRLVGFESTSAAEISIKYQDN